MFEDLGDSLQVAFRCANQQPGHRHPATSVELGGSLTSTDIAASAVVQGVDGGLGRRQGIVTHPPTAGAPLPDDGGRMMWTPHDARDEVMP